MFELEQISTEKKVRVFQLCSAVTPGWLQTEGAPQLLDFAEYAKQLLASKARPVSLTVRRLRVGSTLGSA